MHRILIQGPQGCGKGTQAAMLSERLGVPHLSMGQLLREAAKHDPAISSYTDRGELVPDEIVQRVLAERLAQADCEQGFILDAFPRSESQYRIAEATITPTAVIVIDVPVEVSLDRMRSRARIEKRDDDTPEAMRRRLEIYEEETKPVIEKYRAQGVVREVDGRGSIEDVAARIYGVCSAQGGC